MDAAATAAEDHGFPAAVNRAFEMVASDFAADRYRQVAGHPAAGRGGVEIERGICARSTVTRRQMFPVSLHRTTALKTGGDGAAGS